MATKIEIQGKYYFHNHRLAEVEKFYVVEASKIVYEVIRLIDGVPLFLEDHFERLKNSCMEMGLHFDWQQSGLEAELRTLSQENNIDVGNVMLRLLLHDEELVVRTYFIPHRYPSELMYKQGLKVGLMHAVRSHPNAKVVLQSLRERTNEFISANDLFEVLLVDHHGKITEASRANFFFIKGDKLITAPLETVLQGITLLKVLQLANMLKIKVEFHQVAVAELNKYDAAFLTGTSPKLLPVRYINSIPLEVQNPLLNKLMKAYNELIVEYLESKK